MRCEAQLKEIAKGDRQAFNALYRERHRPLLCFATGLLAGDASAAEDIINEAFCAIWTQAGNFSGAGSAEGWIRRIVRNKAVDWIRKQREKPTLSEADTQAANDQSDDGPDPFESLAQSRAATQLRKALASLSVDHREAIWLCYFEDRPLSEIAEITGCPENTVKTRLFHARKSLKQSGLLSNNMSAS
jgi:RNA polymerase sigma-70 factor, ECF subfamily